MTTERRKYFRIQDTALVKYRIINDEMLDAERREVYLDQIKGENTRAALYGLETHLQDVFDGLRETDPAIVEAMELINRKIHLLERVVSLENRGGEQGDHFEHEPREINLSAGGMAIMAAKTLDVGAHLAIDLVLLPYNDPMRIFGSVVAVRQDADGQHEISISFDEIRECDQEKLVQHVLRRQAEELRSARLAADA